MRAIVSHHYGGPETMRLEEALKPTPDDDQVLVKVYAVSFNAADRRMLRGKPFMLRMAGYGLFNPKVKILGADIAGKVEAVGKSVTQFKPGDDVFGDIFHDDFGGLAEYVCASEKWLVKKPANLTWEEAAAVPMAAVTALHALRDSGQLKAGQHVAINGASGGVGTYAIQIAKALGAEVTAVCSTGKMETARSLGADHIVDYTKEDFTKSDAKYDLILGANGFHPLKDYKRALKPEGRYLMSGGTMKQITQATLLGKFSSSKQQKMGMVSSKPDQKDLEYVKSLIEAGKVKPVIDKVYTLEEAAQAMAYLEEEHARGKIVVKVAEGKTLNTKR